MVMLRNLHQVPFLERIRFVTVSRDAARTCEKLLTGGTHLTQPQRDACAAVVSAYMNEVPVDPAVCAPLQTINVLSQNQWGQGATP